MSGLTDFLLQRIAEDEERAKYDHAHWADCEHFLYFDEGGLPCTCGMEVRLLADCEAKRRIVEAHRTQVEDDDQHAWIVGSGVLLRALAAIYADHPDYDEAWKP